MPNQRTVVVLAICMLLFTNRILAQSGGWKTETTKDGKISVKYLISNHTGAKGKEEQLVEYAASTTAKASMTKLISIFKDVSKHKEIMGQESSYKVKTISDSECIVYYFYKGVWPYPSSDVVARMKFHENETKQTATFTLTADPSLLKDMEVKRLDYYNLTYTFKDLENSKVEITIAAKFTPAVHLPAFLMKTWFPDGPADYLLAIIKLANDGK
jgi:hypothetical protein